MTVDIDPSTQANYTQIASEHVHFDWTIDWTKQVIAGSATHTLAVREDGVKEVMYVLLYGSSRAAHSNGDVTQLGKCNHNARIHM